LKNIMKVPCGWARFWGAEAEHDDPALSVIIIDQGGFVVQDVITD